MSPRISCGVWLEYLDPDRTPQLMRGDNITIGKKMNNALLEILVCPICKGKLHLDKIKNELICKVDKLAYPIRDDIPIMLEDEARKLTLEELG